MYNLDIHNVLYGYPYSTYHTVWICTESMQHIERIGKRSIRYGSRGPTNLNDIIYGIAVGTVRISCRLCHNIVVSPFVIRTGHIYDEHMSRKKNARHGRLYIYHYLVLVLFHTYNIVHSRTGSQKAQLSRLLFIRSEIPAGFEYPKRVSAPSPVVCEEERTERTRNER